MTGRIPENALVVPALECMYDTPTGAILTKDLIARLTDIFEPEGEDVEILEGRQDTKFSQKVRNLKSHKTLKNAGLAEHTPRGFRVTQTGRRLIKKIRGE
ncbi:MAG: hypothetical protein O7A64_10905 [Alphaproteobacteria bacterium]|nr:hypothetical protein [Alphaproteobacteria bacterium]